MVSIEGTRSGLYGGGRLVELFGALAVAACGDEPPGPYDDIPEGTERIATPLEAVAGPSEAALEGCAERVEKGTPEEGDRLGIAQYQKCVALDLAR